MRTERCVKKILVLFVVVVAVLVLISVYYKAFKICAVKIEGERLKMLQKGINNRVDIGFLMRLHHSTQAESKLRKCFKDLSLSYLLNNYTFWLKAKNNVENILTLFNQVITDEVDSSRHNSFCWKTHLAVHLDKNGILKGKLGDHTILTDNAATLSDPRFYYHLMLKYKSGIIDSSGINQSLICIPKVFLAGFPKSGTTAVDSLLTLHPLIMHGLSKEPRWWSPPLKTPNQNKFKLTIDYFVKYALQYSNTVNKIKENRHILLLDSSPNLFSSWSNVGLAEDFEDICLLPVVMSVVLPNPMFIVVLRNPIDFLYSRFWHSCSSTVYNNITLANPENGPGVFHSMVIRRLGIFAKCRLLYSTERCALAQAYIQDKASDEGFDCGIVPLHFAFYYVHVTKWTSVISKQNFFITTYENYFKKPFSETQKMWNFLEIPQPLHIKPEHWKNRLEKGKNENRKYNYHKTVKLEMLPKTRSILKQFFHPFNILLSTIIGESDFVHLWK